MDFFAKLSVKNWLIPVLGLAFIIVNTVFILSEFYWFGLVSAALLVGLAYIYTPDKLLIFISFLTPLAINLSDFDMQIGLSIPTEPLLAIFVVLIIADFLYNNKFDSRVLLHPLSIAIYFYFVWMIITVITSEMPVISLKWLAARIWFFVPIYFFGTHIFRNPKNIWYFVNAYVAGFVVVIVYTLIHHATNNFTSESGHWVMTPFFNDHTSYGALLALFIPYLTGALFIKEIKSNLKLLLFALLGLFLLAIVLSISRAAWASVLFALGLWVLIYFKIKFKWILSGVVVLLFFFLANQAQIIMRLEKNKQDAKGGLKEHVESVSNVATDASNLERINRWKSAVRMFKERPITGWGPGTYQFIYAPYQRSFEKTVISVNTGTQGTAHSEYLLILSEQGLPGLISLVLIFGFIISVAVRNHHLLKNQKLRMLNLTLLLGLSTYLAHAVFNNFLDTDKAAIPFWGFVAAITSLSVYAREIPESKKQN
ncbi:MAG: O-antigen ligase family protein [Bacteroidales bacterium]|nr:O-antigen ligase family protein [Bacteroidales bacterium]